MKYLLARWISTTLAILLVPELVPGVSVDGIGAALLAAALLGLLNTLARPVLVLLTLPLTIISLGLFLLIINALLFYFAGALVPGLHVSSFGAAFWASLLVSAVTWLLSALGPRKGSGPRIKIMRWERKPRRPVDSQTIELEEDGAGHWR